MQVIGRSNEFLWKTMFGFFVFSAHTPIALSASGDVDLTFTHQSDSNDQENMNKNIGNDVIYQIFVDRFANGNAGNDDLDGGKFSSPEQSDWFKYWGGDLSGVIQKLPYLKNLGVSKIWLTPIFENQNVTVERVRHGRRTEVTSYHGYWLKDLFRLNPYFTDEGRDDLDIVDRMIESGLPEIRFFLDSVANHSSPSDPTPWSLEYQQSLDPVQGPSRTHLGALFQNGEYLTSLSEDQYLAQNDPSYKRLFHHTPPIIDWDSQYQVENYTLDGLADFDQTNAVMKNYLWEGHAFWLRRFPQLAGYRMDTIKHVPQSFWKDFSGQFFSEFSDRAIFGEFFGAGSTNVLSHEFYNETRMSLLDFDFRSAVERIFLQNGSFELLTEIWAADPRMNDARSLVTFLDNHDLPRLRGMGMSHLVMQQALALLFATRGVPCLYYGIEQDLHVPVDSGDPFNRPMMRNFDETSQFFKLVKTLNSIRKSNEALRYGSTHVAHLTRNIIGFERIYGDNIVFFATSKNPRAGADVFSMKSLQLPDGEYKDLLNGKSYRVENGNLPVALETGDVVLLSSNR